MTKPGKHQMPRSRGSPKRLDPPAASSSVARAAFLLFPKSGYPNCLSKEDPDSIRQIRCGRGCLAIVKTNRTVVLYDKARERGDQKQSRSPKQVKLRKNFKVDSVDCEASHLLLLSSEGKLFEYSFAARSDKSEPRNRLLKELGHRQIIQISCGDHHSLALSKGGELFAWGQNTCGQLGVGRQTECVKEPCKIQTLQGIPLAQIAAGSSHSLALSVFGMVYSWGKNAFGQLGLGDTKDRYSPVSVKALQHTNTSFISCGGEHTAAVSKDGLLCTFGAGNYGQLGHNSRHNEIFPRLVAQLLGVRVSQVACGRWHTLVYIPDLGEVHSFGSSADGQLGYEEKCDRLIPLPVELKRKGKKITWEKSTSEDLIKIIAGENQSVILLLKEKNSYVNLNRTLCRVEEEKVDKWVSNSNPTSWNHIQNNIRLKFSSLACLNGSFQKTREKHFRNFWEATDVDMSAVIVFGDKIAAKPKIFTKVINSLKKLIKNLPSFFVFPEALRFFLIVPVLLRRMDIKSDSLLTELAQVIVTLQQEDQQVLEILWTNLEVAFFKDLVDTFRRLVSNKLLSFMNSRILVADRNKDLSLPLQVLQMLYKINCRSGFKIQESNFCVPEVKLLPQLPNQNPIRNLEQLESGSQLALNRFLLLSDVLIQFPFIFETEDKIDVYESQNIFHQTIANMQHFNELEELGGHELCVRRQHLLQDTWHYLRSKIMDPVQQSLKVRFVGEPGIDEGAVAQEFFTILRRELCALEAQIFEYFEDSHLIWFSSKVPVEEDVYFLLGCLFGMAVYNKKIAAFPFPLALFKKMANIQPTLEDLKELSPVIGSNLQVVLDEDYDDIIENMMLNFTVSLEYEGTIIDVDLKENGANIPVTKYNRKEYVDAYVNYVFNKAIEKQFEDFMHGFHIGCPVDAWKIFLPIELQVVVCGHAKYDWEQLEKNTKYSDYEQSEETIKNFWAVFHDLPERNKKKFLVFLTGTDRIPAEGMKRFTFTIKDPRREDPDQWYPEASTCSRVFLLPRYTRRDIVKDRLLDALGHYEKFGLR